MEKFDAKIPLRYGLIAFSTILTIGLMTYFFYKVVFASLVFFNFIRFISLVLALFLAIWSGITYRREQNGIISFAHSFLAVYLVFVLFVVGYVSSVFIVNKVIDRDYPNNATELLKKNIIAGLEKNNVTAEDIKDRVSQMTPDKLDPPLFETLTRWLGLTGIVSFLIGLFIKRGSGDLILTDSQPEPIRSI